jgi:hypothetical protein
VIKLQTLPNRKREVSYEIGYSTTKPGTYVLRVERASTATNAVGDQAGPVTVSSAHVSSAHVSSAKIPAPGDSTRCATSRGHDRRRESATGVKCARADHNLLAC